MEEENFKNKNLENSQIVTGSIIMISAVMMMVVAWLIGTSIGEVIGEGINFITGR
ncbi:MAG: hypothetical protein FWG67_04545 [Defluviitaleaceae bacterium]|nr:hypothetical protein [Defluviitaleaceae bacterium]